MDRAATAKYRGSPIRHPHSTRQELRAFDAQTRADLEDLIRSVWKKLGVTVLFVTHDIDESIYPGERDQLETRSLPRFTELRHHVYAEIQKAKQGYRHEEAITMAVQSSS